MSPPNRRTISYRRGRGENCREGERVLNFGGSDPLMQTKRKIGYGVEPGPGS